MFIIGKATAFAAGLKNIFPGNRKDLAAYAEPFEKERGCLMSTFLVKYIMNYRKFFQVGELLFLVLARNLGGWDWWMGMQIL